ncbi:very short patch repair endonuclease [Acidisphaera rubrifaciens]|nr:very short patch repair endonuclease [Acidisphaera rubrifaciens]
MPRQQATEVISEARRRNMAAIGGKNTKPELAVRRIIHAMGYRYRLHAATLPGRPDIVFPGRRKIIDVRGCFWHRHPGCPRATTPVARRDFWEDKFRATVTRDERNLAALRRSGWQVLVVWECELAGGHLAEQFRTFLGTPGPLRGDERLNRLADVSMHSPSLVR